MSYCFYHMSCRKEEGPDSSENLLLGDTEQFLPCVLKIRRQFFRALLLEI